MVGGDANNFYTYQLFIGLIGWLPVRRMVDWTVIWA
jgi:hypothetical protein